MISSVRGTILSAAAASVIIEVGGVGLAVAVTPQHAAQLRPGATALLHTALIVRDDDLALYGFGQLDELAMFDLLRSVTGVGPKSAMGVLAAMTPDQIAIAVGAEDDGAFRKVTGIGTKTAKLIVVSLAGKIKLVAASVPDGSGTSSPLTGSVLSALVGLGWSERVAAQAISDALASGSDQPLSVPALLRNALGQLRPHPVSESEPSVD